MRKILVTAAAAIVVACSTTTQQLPQVTWTTLGNVADTAGNYSYTQRFTIVAQGPFERLAFNQFARRMDVADPTDTLIELVPGYYVVGSPRFAQAQAGDTIVVDIITHAALRNICYAPDGVHLVAAGAPVTVDYAVGDILGDPANWSAAGIDRMPYGEEVFAFNEALATDATPGPYDVIPSYKSVTLTGGESAVPATIDFQPIDSGAPEYCRIVVADGKVTLFTRPENRVAAERRFMRHTAGRGLTSLPNAVIEDWPDYGYRGLMIDVARNYLTPAQLERIIDMMADYGFNTLHFHFADDEAWRLQIAALPELTEVGGRRGYTTDESDYLMQIFAGNGDPESHDYTSNGYFTRADFVAMLRHADSLGIRVIPEIESPGHARAAIIAMAKRARTTGDDSWILRDPADTSKFTSAQSFHDNAMNPALPGPYKLMEAVADELVDMYTEAGLTLPALHIGGDEVARGAWDGSPAAQQFMAEHGLANQHELHAWWVQRINEMLRSKGVRLSGWQEIAVNHSPEYNDAVRDNVYSVNCWTVAPADGKTVITIEALRGGFPVVLSNVNHFYMDMCYSNHPLERGLNWGGTVNEFDALAGYPDAMCNAPADVAGSIIGMSGQLFGETLRGDRMMEAYILPKMLGLAERAWNAQPTYTDAAFHAVISDVEMPLWIKEGRRFHLHQPGIALRDGKLVMNQPYGSQGTIHYTLDGTTPTVDSPVYSSALDAAGVRQARAIVVVGDMVSVPTLLNVE